MILIKEEHADVASPCIQLCKIDKEIALCQGCMRTIDEITVWSKASRELKLEIWGRIEERKVRV